MADVAAKKTARLNPFEFRAGIYLFILPRAYSYRAVLIPLNSGLVFTWRCGNTSFILPVLIPLNSGLVFTYIYRPCSWLRRSLNPFEFRAGIYLARASTIYCALWVLIPLNSGLVFTYWGYVIVCVQRGLNPFEFRAGIYLRVCYAIYVFRRS